MENSLKKQTKLLFYCIITVINFKIIFESDSFQKNILLYFYCRNPKNYFIVKYLTNLKVTYTKIHLNKVKIFPFSFFLFCTYTKQKNNN